MTPVFYATKIHKNNDLVHENQRKYNSYIDGLKEGRYVVTIKKYVEKRSLKQNAYYHGVVVKMIADHCGMSPDEAHDGLKGMFLRIENDLLPTIGSTRKLSTVDFIAYIEKCVIWAAEFLSLVIPDPYEVNYQ